MRGSFSSFFKWDPLQFRSENFMISCLSPHTNTHRFPQTHSGLGTSVRLCAYEFSVLFHFYSPFSSFPHPSCSLSSPALLFFIISPLFCFSFKLPRLSSSLILSHPAPFAPSASSLRLAVFIFQSFISTNVRQCFCPPSIDPQREEEMKRKMGEMGEQQQKAGVGLNGGMR